MPEMGLPVPPDPKTMDVQRADALDMMRSGHMDSSALAVTVALLADGSRQDVLLRQKLAEASILTNLVRIVEEGSDRAEASRTVINALRCIGNACADNDDARSVVISKGFKWAIRYLQSADMEIKDIATKVIYNICSDYGAAQQQCYRDGVHYTLVETMTSFFREAKADISLPIDLMFWITGHKADLEPVLSNPMSTELIYQLLMLPQFCPGRASVDDYATLIETVLVFVRDATIQKQMIEDKLLECLWVTLQALESRASSACRSHGEEAEDVKILGSLSTNIVWCLSDLAANEEFAKKYPLGEPTVELLLLEIKSGATLTSDTMTGDARESLVAASCQVLGNLIRNLELQSSVHLVEAVGIHDHLFAYIVRSQSTRATAGLLHSAAGMLTQLSRSSITAREIMGKSEACLSALVKLCHYEMQEVKEDGIRLLRALGLGCPANQEKFAGLAKEVMASVRESGHPPSAEVT